MIIRILTESEKGLGLGHVARCYNLARSFVASGYSVDFFVRGNAPFKPFIDRQGVLTNDGAKCYPLALQWENMESPTLLLSDICIIDSYVVDDFTKFLDTTKILVLLDDFGNHLSKLTQLQNAEKAQIFLLNPNGFYGTMELPISIREHIFSGLQYALLHPCFHKAYLGFHNVLHEFNDTLPNFYNDSNNISCGFHETLSSSYDNAINLNNVSRNSYDIASSSCDTSLKSLHFFEFLVCLGGEDANDVSADIFTQLLQFSKSVVVIVGAGYNGSLLNSKYSCKENLCKDSKDFSEPRIYHNITQERVAALLSHSKNCIVSGGGIVFEALKLCEKVFVINLAKNQDIQIKTLAKQNLVQSVTLPLKQSFFMLKTNASKKTRENIGVGVADFTSKLVLFAINKTLSITQNKKAQDFSLNDYCAINFCNLSQSEGMYILSYRNHPFVRENMYGSSTISQQTHQNFLQSLNGEVNSRYFLVKDKKSLQTIESGETHDLGVISFSRINLKHRNAYFGIYKNPFLPKTKKGCGHALMQMIKHIAFSHYNLYMLYLEVVETNINAIRFYENEGFIYFGTLQNGFRLQENGCEMFKNVLLYGIKNPSIGEK